VILGKGIKESVATGFNMFTDYCGYHSTGITATALKQKFYMAVVGLPIGNPACIPIAIQNLAPIDPALDGSMSTIVHEIAETATSPDENGWQDSQFLEVADKCNVRYTNSVELWFILLVDKDG
jgi:hypothetical protein